MDMKEIRGKDLIPSLWDFSGLRTWKPDGFRPLKPHKVVVERVVSTQFLPKDEELSPWEDKMKFMLLCAFVRAGIQVPLDCTTEDLRVVFCKDRNKVILLFDCDLVVRWMDANQDSHVLVAQFHGWHHRKFPKKAVKDALLRRVVESMGPHAHLLEMWFDPTRPHSEDHQHEKFDPVNFWEVASRLSEFGVGNVSPDRFVPLRGCPDPLFHIE
jgi:hypothetical protein